MATRKPKPTPTMSRRATERVLAATMPTADLYTRRGKCLACGNRWAVVRVVLTMTSAARVERYATHECSRCGHTWRRVAATMPIQTGGGTQRVRLSLILPSNTLRTWHSHGVWHRDGDDSASIIDATFADVDEAYAEWTKRNGTYTAKLERARVKRETERAASHEATMATLARWAERDAERAADEAAAAAREAATA